MYLFQYVCRIDPEGALAHDSRFDHVGGAYVDIWVGFAEQEGASFLSRFYVHRAGWIIDTAVGAWTVKRKKCRKRDRPFFDEAKKYGYSSVYWMWPKDAPDASLNYETVRKNSGERRVAESSPAEIKSMVDIEQEPRGETYLALLRFAATRCQLFSLVWQDQFTFNPSAQEIAAALEPYLVSEDHTDYWPGTQLIGHKAVVRFYQLTPESLPFLQRAGGLYAWLAPNLPEDIAFYSTEQNLCLGTISHERDAWFAEESLSRAEIIEKIPGIVLGQQPALFR